MINIILLVLSLYTFSLAELNTESEIFTEAKLMESKNIYSVGVRNYTKINYRNISLNWSATARNNSSYFKSSIYATYRQREKKEFYFDRLYLQTRLGSYNDLSVAFIYGIVPLTGGNFKKFSNSDELQGNMLFTMIDTHSVGWFLLLSYDNLSIKLGEAYVRQHGISSSPKIDKHFDGTGGFFASLEYRHDKHFIELNYISADTIISLSGIDHLELFSTEMFGLGYSYDDSIDTGLVYYSLLTFSNRELDTTSIPLGKILDSLKGQAILIGIKDYLELYSQEGSIGLELFKTFGNYTSFISGDLWENDYDSFFGDKITYKGYFDFIYNNKLTIHIEAIHITEYKRRLGLVKFKNYTLSIKYSF